MQRSSVDPSMEKASVAFVHGEVGKIAHQCFLAFAHYVRETACGHTRAWVSVARQFAA